MIYGIWLLLVTLSLSASNLVGCAREQEKYYPKYYPMNSGMSWEYGVTYNLPVLLGGSSNVRMEVKNFPKRKLDGKEVVPQKVTLGLNKDEDTSVSFHFVGIDSEGIFTYAEQSSDQPEPNVLPVREYFIQYPLEEGTTWQHSSETSNSETTLVSIETVTVPAGNFDDCLKLKEEGEKKIDKDDIFWNLITMGLKGTGRVHYESTVWYAPDVGMVKFYEKEYSESAGRSDRLEFEKIFGKRQREIHGELMSVNKKGERQSLERIPLVSKEKKDQASRSSVPRGWHSSEKRPSTAEVLGKNVLIDSTFKDLVRGLSQIGATLSHPCSIGILSNNVFKIAFGDEDSYSCYHTKHYRTGEKPPVAVATNYGNGRVVAVGHECYFSSQHIHENDNLEFGLNIMDWLDKNKGKRVLFDGRTLNYSWGNKFYNGLMSQIRRIGYKIDILRPSMTQDKLKNYDVYVIATSWDSFRNNEIDAITDFVNLGGGLFLIGVGWSWIDYHRDTKLDDYPMNRIAQKFGIRFQDDIICDPTNNHGEPRLPIFHLFYEDSQKEGVGSDGQRGVHIVLEVQTQKAVKTRLEGVAEELRMSMTKRGIHGAMSLPNNMEISVRIPNNENIQLFESLLDQDYRDFRMLSRTREGGCLLIRLDFHPNIVEYIKEMAAKQTMETIRKRVDRFGVSELDMSRQGQNRIIVRIIGVKDYPRVIDLIATRGLLEFKLVDEDHSVEAALKGHVPPGDEILYQVVKDKATGRISKTPFLVQKRTHLTGEYVTDARVQIDSQFNEPYVVLGFNKRGARFLERITEANVKKRVAIVVDDRVYSASVIREKISGGRTRITGDFTAEEAHDLAIILHAGALSAPVRILEERTVGLSSSRDSIQNGLISVLFRVTSRDVHK